MSYQVEHAVTVCAMDGPRERMIRLGVATDPYTGRTGFGLCAYDSPSASLPAELDVLTIICYYVGEGGLDPAEMLERARETGWFVLHDATPLKVSATELEVALYRLHLLESIGEDAEDVPGGWRMTDAPREDDVPRGRPLSQAVRLTADQNTILATLASAGVGGPAVAIHQVEDGVWRIGTLKRHTYAWEEFHGLFTAGLAEVMYEPTPTKRIVAITAAGRRRVTADLLRDTREALTAREVQMPELPDDPIVVNATDLAEVLGAAALEVGTLPDSWFRLHALLPDPATPAPEEYQGVPVPDDLRPNWDQVEAEWWRRGVTAATDFPRRGDAVERWRVGALLNEYRQRASAGEPLDKGLED